MNFFSRTSTAEILLDDASSVGASGIDAGRAARATTSNLADSAKRASAKIIAFVRDQPQWIIIGLLYAWVWYNPFSVYSRNGDGPLAWCWDFWSSITLPLGFQLYVPLAVGVLIWLRRDALAAQWRWVVTHYPEHHPKREGNLVPLILGALLFVFSHFVVVKGFGVGAAILIAYGVAYRLYGSAIIRILLMPFIVFLIMIPLPDSLVEAYFVGKPLNAEIKAASLFLNLMHVHTITAGRLLVVNGIPVSVSEHVYSGFGIASAAAFLSFVFCSCRRITALPTLWMVVAAFLISFVIHVFRVVAIAITYSPQIELAKLIASPFFSWCEIAVAFGLAYQVIRLQVRRIDVKINTPLSVQHAVRLAGNGIETMALPLVGVGKVFRLIGAGWTWSEHRLERLLKALTPKRKRRRSGNTRRR